MQEMQVQSWGGEVLEEGMETHSGILDWRSHRQRSLPGYSPYGHKRGLVAQSCPTLCDSMNCSPSGSSIHGVLQARILEWIAIPFSRGSSWPRDRTQVSFIAGRFFTIWATGKIFTGWQSWTQIKQLSTHTCLPLVFTVSLSMDCQRR